MIVSLCAFLLEYRGTRVASPLTHLEEFANVTPRELWCKRMEQQTDALLVKATDKSMCQGVGNGLKTSLNKRNSQVNHVRWYSKTGQLMRLNKSCQVISVCNWSKNHNNNMHQSRAQCTAIQFESRRANASQHDAALCKKSR